MAVVVIAVSAGLLVSFIVIHAQPPPCNVCGDVSGDGVVNAIDALQAAQLGAGFEVEPPCPAAADVTGDHWITNQDVLLIARSIVGHHAVLPGPTPCSLIGVP